MLKKSYTFMENTPVTSKLLIYKGKGRTLVCLGAFLICIFNNNMFFSVRENVHFFFCFYQMVFYCRTTKSVSILGSAKTIVGL